MKLKGKKKEAYRDKNLKVKLHCLDAPGKDVSIEIYKHYRISQPEVKRAEKKLRDLIYKWWDNASSTDPCHLIIAPSTPGGYTGHKEYNMVFSMNVSLYLFEDVVLGKNNFPGGFLKDIEELVELLKK